MSRTIALVTNDRAGTSDDETLRRIEDVLSGSGDIVRVPVGDCIDAVPDELSGCDLVVAAGGDGTVHLTVGALHRSGLEVPLAVVPLGTGNDLARTLGLDPDDPVTAAEIALGGNASPIDVIERSGGVVVNAAHTGLGAVAAEVADDKKERLGALAYPVGAVIAAVRERGWELQVRVDGELVCNGPALMVGVGNGRTIGGGTPLFPDAVLDDGLLDVVVATCTGPVERIAFGAALRKGTHVERDDVTTFRGRHVEIDGEPVVHNTDGELGDEQASETYEIVAGAVRVVRPAQS